MLRSLFCLVRLERLNCQRREGDCSATAFGLGRGLRHTHISHQLMDGVHVKVVSERAGHANVSITLSVYATFLPNLQDKAVAAMDLWLSRELAEQVGDNSAFSNQAQNAK
jgi:integrase